MNLFSKKKAQAGLSSSSSSAVSAVDTVKMLRDNLETLDKREAHINKKIEVALTEAKQKASKKDKKGALFALKRKKLYEGEVLKLQGAKISLESQIIALESATVNIETFKAMKSGADAMKAIRGNIDADKVEDMMDEMQEERELHDAISEAISRPAGDIFDDEELLNELEEIESMELEEPVAEVKMATRQPIASNHTLSLPQVPSSKILSDQSFESEEERALRELQASMLA